MTANATKMVIGWKSTPKIGEIIAINGTIKSLLPEASKCTVNNHTFQFTNRTSGRIGIEFENCRTFPGANSTIVSVKTENHNFSFFLRDVSSKSPIVLPEYGVFITEFGDARNYDQIYTAIKTKGLSTALERYEFSPEESFENTASQVRKMRCPIWLGLSRDHRLFELYLPEDQGIFQNDMPGRLHTIEPKFHNSRVFIPERNDSPCRYFFWLGRGHGASENITRYIENGTIPIFKARIEDEGILYDCTAFCSLEKESLNKHTLVGTHFIVAGGKNAIGRTDEQKQLFNALEPNELNQSQETILCFHAQAVNTGQVPKYAFFKTVSINSPYRFDGNTGFSSYSKDRIFAVSTLDGKPLPQEEIAVLVPPGSCVNFSFTIPHRPVSESRANDLISRDYNRIHREVRDFWKEKIQSASKVSLPESRINEALYAGLLHLDMICYGREPDEPLAPTIGNYQPIASESAPIIQFLDSMGRHDLARRTIGYFLKLQHENGRIYNWYDIETGVFLWMVGEHYRYTRDKAWIEEILPKLEKAYEYLLNWRKQNQKNEYRNLCYGLINGKACDPDDNYHLFTVNGYAYMGMKRFSEILMDVDPRKAEQVHQESRAYLQDIRTAFFDALGRSPVIPLEDGTWGAYPPPWAQGTGPCLLFTTDENCFSHGTFTIRDSIAGPLYLIFQEVLGPEEGISKRMLEIHYELMCRNGAALSQPYYSRHPWVALKMGFVRAFLKSYYSTYASLADREIRTFWEHYYHISAHKTHEEAWFLMQTRWMLYMEEEDQINLLPGIPRAWLKNNQYIILQDMASYFGHFNLSVRSRIDENIIECRIQFRQNRYPARAVIRLPHPYFKKAQSVEGGIYHTCSESVSVELENGNAEILLSF